MNEFTYGVCIFLIPGFLWSIWNELDGSYIMVLRFSVEIGLSNWNTYLANNNVICIYQVFRFLVLRLDINQRYKAAHVM